MSETAAYLELESLRWQSCVCLIRVCRLWRLVAAEFLHEDVRIMNARSLRSLVGGLRRSWDKGGRGGFGRYIQRLELPVRQTNFSHQNSRLYPFPMPPFIPNPSTFHLNDLLRLCPHLEILVRPCLRLDAEDIHFWASLIESPLESVIRLLRV
jgi:hypothetical protein